MNCPFCNRPLTITDAHDPPHSKLAAHPMAAGERGRDAGESAMTGRVDRFYFAHGRCCAGCDHWRHLRGGVIGECSRSPVLSEVERTSLLGMTAVSMSVGAGLALTPRAFVCGEFRDSFDWKSLPAEYLRSIGHKELA